MQEQRPKRLFIKQSISSRLKCPICYDVFTKPRRLFCGHTYCKQCLKKMFEPHKNPEHVPNCPLCRVPIVTEDIGYDLVCIQIIDNLEVMCPVKECPWRGRNSKLEKHYLSQCRMRQYMQQSMGSTIVENIDDFEDDVDQRINQHTQKGSLVSRIISKNPHLLTFKTCEEEEDQPIYDQVVYQPCVKIVVTRGTQTQRVKTNRGMLKKQEKRRQLWRESPPCGNQKIKQNTFMQAEEESISPYIQRFKDQSSNYADMTPKPPIINLQQTGQHVAKNRRSRPRICSKL